MLIRSWVCIKENTIPAHVGVAAAHARIRIERIIMFFQWATISSSSPVPEPLYAAAKVFRILVTHLFRRVTVKFVAKVFTFILRQVDMSRWTGRRQSEVSRLFV
jgi:hypothetical protein